MEARLDNADFNAALNKKQSRAEFDVNKLVVREE